MYRIDDEKNANRQVQTYLRELSYAYGDLPQITVDGIYGEETKKAVHAFQNKFGLTATGEVDLATFNLLYEESVGAREERAGQSELLSASVFPLQKGDSGSEVRILQSVIGELLGLRIPFDGFYGRATEDGVRAFQRKYQYPPSGIVDRKLWNRIAKEYRLLTENKKSP